MIAFKPCCFAERIAPKVELEHRLMPDGQVRLVAVVESPGERSQDMPRAVWLARQALARDPRVIGFVEIRVPRAAAERIARAQQARHPRPPAPVLPFKGGR